MKEKIFLIIFLLLIFTQEILALTAESNNYSVSMFGSGVQATNFSSDTLEASSVLLANAGTRNAENSQFTANVGFWENTTYYVSVSITSYSISPASATVGSTLSLSISALNAQSVWAKIISPNAQEQTLTLTNNQAVNYVSSASVAGTYSVTFYANSSSGAIASAVSSFVLTAQTTSPSGGGSSGGGGSGGTTTIIEKTCNYLWDCTPWNLCRDGKQKRECKMIGECDEIEIKKPTEEIECSEALFDITLKLNDMELTQNRYLIFNIELDDKIGIEKFDVHIKYSIIKDNKEIFSQIETKAIKENLSYSKKIDELKLDDGEYTLRVDILYGNMQRAFAEQSFAVEDGKIKIIQKTSSKQKLTLISLVVLIFLVVGLIISTIYHYGRLKELIREVNALKGKTKYIFIFIAIITFGILFYKFGLINLFVITGKTIVYEISRQISWLALFYLIFAIAVILFALLCRKKIKEIVEKVKDKFIKKYSCDSISGLINKKVYSDNGHYIGKINGVVLGKNKIESLKIKLDKKHKSKTKGIVVNYKNVKSVGEIIIIEKEVCEHLESS